MGSTPRTFSFASARPHRAGWVAGCACLVGGVALWLGAWRLRDQQLAWPTFSDDAFYYLQVAENFVAGRDWSMDGLHATNGFHPLWMAVLLPIYASGLDPQSSALAVIQFVTLALFAASAGLVTDLVARRAGAAPAALACLLLLFPRYLNVMTSGMEAGVLVLTLVVVARHLILRDTLVAAMPRLSDGWLGLWLALVVLARLDTVWTLFAVAGMLLIRGLVDRSLPFGRRPFRVVVKGLAVFWPVLVLLAPYLAWNQIRFGSFVPISGALKSSFPAIEPRLSYLSTFAEYVALLGAGALAALLPAARKADPRTSLALLVLVVGGAAHFAFTTIFMQWAVMRWHFASYLPIGSLSAAHLGRLLIGRTGSEIGVVGSFVLIIVWTMLHSFTIVLSREPTGFQPAAMEGGAWARQHLPSDVLLAMKDSGTFTYVSRRRVVNLDGVISNMEYQRELCGGKLLTYLRRIGVKYVVQHAVYAERGYEAYEQLYPCHLRGGAPSRIRFREADEAFRSKAYRGRGGAAWLVIWKLPAE